jgi:hypothetical protein
MIVELKEIPYREKEIKKREKEKGNAFGAQPIPPACVSVFCDCR